MYDPYIHKTFDEYLLVDKANNHVDSSKRWDHYHDFYEMYYYLGNEMTYFIDNEVYTVRENDLVFIQPFLFHRTVYQHENERSRILILFHPKILQQISLYSEELSNKMQEIFSSKRKVSFRNDKSKKLLDHGVMHLYNVSRTITSDYKKIAMLCALIELFITILDLSSDEIYETSTPKLSPKDKLVYKVIRYINDNYTQPITLEEICSNLYISKFYLSHTFKEITGVTVVNFINKKRLSEAERLLRYSSLNITEVCHAVGFNSIGHFINLFTKDYQCTPSAFRKRIE
ncbi:AraC-like DNA-binding protein [Anaerotaenia torta]|uniref:AraC family transcriptional regulator n=1 Tax=Anaerotaenia torta TaxID=433293 RepID=UPI003D1D9844